VSKFFCDKIVDVLPSKTILINNEQTTLKTAKCIKLEQEK
jgi:hypothetical protein